jgi:uncharacterized metal-binding protein (TIGR02443 family)
LFDAEGSFEGVTCPGCGRTNTVTYRYDEGFDELECLDCGYLSDHEELAALQRYDGALLEGDEAEAAPVIPFRRIKA